MRKRVHKVANFLAFNLLFFALYLNFIYKDPAVTPSVPKSHHEPAAFSGLLTADKSATNQSKPEPSVKAAGLSGEKDTY